MNGPAHPSLAFTGERYTPEVTGAIGYEHWHRYAVTAPLVQGREVLDAACGEGYGSYVLAATAARVTGIDVDAGAVAHASARYRRPNLDYAQGSVTALPLLDASVDAVVSFETVEHLAEQAQMLAEFRRVLRPQGVLVLSSPNRPVYNEAGGEPNHFHVRELDEAELRALLAPAFPRQAWYGQRVLAGSLVWSRESQRGEVAYDRPVVDAPARDTQPASPMYFLVVAGGDQASLPALPALSVFDDGELSLWRDYARALARERQLAWDELDARKVAEDRLAELVTAVNDLASERQKTDAVRARVAALETELQRIQSTVGAHEAALTAERAAHGETRARLAYRESPAGWARWPLGAARRRLTGAG